MYRPEYANKPVNTLAPKTSDQSANFFKPKNKTGMPDELKQNAENASGLDLDDIKVHYNSPEPAKTGALAYTQGNEIHLGTGQEQYLAHEAWHVVQQKQGRVGSGTLQAKGSLVNDDASLEGEADRMGSQLVSSYFSQPAASHNRLQNNRPSAGIMQCKKVPTSFGDFETTLFQATTGGDFGVDIVLEFQPKRDKVEATKIALSQAARNDDSTGSAYSLYPDQDTKMVPKGKKGEGFSIDVPAESNNPIYSPGSLSATQDLKDTPESDLPGAKLGTKATEAKYIIGHCYKQTATTKNKDKEWQAAGLVDKPLSGKLPGQGKSFETAAFATDGKDAGKYYGSVKWGFKIGGTAAKPVVTPTDISIASKGTPTANFTEAAKLWNTGATMGKLEVAVTSSSVMKEDAKTKALSIGTLPKGTELRMVQTLMVSDDPSIYAEVLKSGKPTGDFVYIKNSDVQDAGGGKATKDLP